VQKKSRSIDWQSSEMASPGSDRDFAMMGWIRNDGVDMGTTHKRRKKKIAGPLRLFYD